ncbi:MAG: zinc-ribbon and DUF3426 domain-containing protein [Methylococcaceae bacterium]|nr:zinc-ribbon and DUF3426 domain-containing protein [Methylococcaceae bacterium]
MADKKRRSGEKKGPPRLNPRSRATAQSGPVQLYTQCPNCKTRYRISVAQLRFGRGKALCQACQIGFNAIDSLAESATFFPANIQPVIRPPLLGWLEAIPPVAEEKPPRLSATEAPGTWVSWDETPGDAQASHIGWAIGLLLLIALLGAQGWRFEGPRLIQNERLRPWLETTCQTLGCYLPPFHAPKRIQIVEHALSPEGMTGYQFSLVVSNQASLPQAFPAIQLSLAALDGSLAASRLFQPAEYLPEQSQATMERGKPYEIHLLLAKPRNEIGGYSFALQ